MEENKKRNIGIVLGISILLIMVIGVTYAAFQYTKSGTKENELSTGTVSFKYNETSNGVTLNNAYPMSDSEGKAMQQGASGEDGENGYFDFDVTSTLGGDMEIQYYVYAVDITGDEENKLDPGFVKVYLTDQSSPENPYEGYDGEVPVYDDLDDITAQSEGEQVEGKLLYQNKFTSSGEHKYRLRLWVSNDYDTTEVAKIFKMRVDVNTEVEVKPKEEEKPTCTIESPSKEFANREEDVTMTIKCTDNSGEVTSNLTDENVHIMQGEEEITPTKKELGEGIALSATTGTNGVQYSLTLGGFESDGAVKVKLDSGIVQDQYKNTNDEATLDTNITIDGTPPICELDTEGLPESVGQNKVLKVKVKCTDNYKKITKDLTNEDITLKIDDTEENATIEVKEATEDEDGKSYPVEISGFSKAGTLTATLNANAVEDQANNGNEETELTKTIEIKEIPGEKDLIDQATPKEVDDYNSATEEQKHQMFEIEQPDGSTAYRYIGNDPYNYLQLGNAIWRIIGVFDEENSEGVKAKRIKLILDGKLNNYTWDNEGTSGLNDWTRLAPLNTALNDLFWNSTSGQCPQNNNGRTTKCDFTSYKMSSVQSKIENMKWHLGAVDSNYTTYSTEKFYSLERGSTAAGGGGETTTTGNVGLAYPSDYGYTYAKGVSNTCYNNPSTCNSSAPSSGWLFNSDYWWLLTPRSDSTSLVFMIASNGRVIHYGAYGDQGVRPVVYLKSNIGITGGKGTKTDPYTVGEKGTKHTATFRKTDNVESIDESVVCYATDESGCKVALPKITPKTGYGTSNSDRYWSIEQGASSGLSENTEITLTGDITYYAYAKDTTKPVCKLNSATPSEKTSPDEDVEIKIDCTDTAGTISKDLTANDIVAKVRGAEVNPSKKTITNTTIENGKQYTITMNGFGKRGVLVLSINADAVTDASNNGNRETTITPNVELKDIACTSASTSTVLGLKYNSNTNQQYEYGCDSTHNMYKFTHPDGTTGYRYIGDDPYNYVTFNGESAGWRIIGVFTDENSSGNKTNRIKLIRDTSIGSYSWDNSNSATNGVSDRGSNNWARPASLYTDLNTTYWGSSSGQCGSGMNNVGTTNATAKTQACDFTSNGLKNVQSRIENMTWKLGGRPVSFPGAEDFYTTERGSTGGGASPSTTTTTGYVGLAYPSDYGYTYGAGFGTTTCFSSNLGSCQNEPTKSWMNKGEWTWLLTPSTSYSFYVFYVNSSGFVYGDNVYGAYAVLPVIYLKSTISVSSGTGSKSNPYVIN